MVHFSHGCFISLSEMRLRNSVLFYYYVRTVILTIMLPDDVKYLVLKCSFADRSRLTEVWVFSPVFHLGASFILHWFSNALHRLSDILSSSWSIIWFTLKVYVCMLMCRITTLWTVISFCCICRKFNFKKTYITLKACLKF